jgi:hypothetical protein
MASRDLYHNVSVEQHIAPAFFTATEDPANGVDLAGYESGTVELNVGVWTDGTFAFEVQESDDDSTYTAVDDADLMGSEPTIDAADEDLVIHLIGYKGGKRYIKVVCTVTGTPTTGMVFGVNVIKGHPHHAPVN